MNLAVSPVPVSGRTPRSGGGDSTPPFHPTPAPTVRAGFVGEAAAHVALAVWAVGLGAGGVPVVEVVGSGEGDGSRGQVAVDDVAGPGNPCVTGAW